MSDNRSRKSKPLPAHVVKKFRENNERSTFQAQLRKVIDDFNEHLETFGEIRNRRLFGCPYTLACAIERYFQNAGWSVTIEHREDVCVFNIKCD